MSNPTSPSATIRTEILGNNRAEDFDHLPADSQSSKKADLAGPGIGDYDQLQHILPRDYNPLLNPKETQQAIFQVKRYIEDNLCKELNLMMVEVPLDR